MSDFTISTRIKHKYRTEEEWNKIPSFIPLAGELIIYAPDRRYKNIRFKVGDGTTKLSSLKFFESGDKTGEGVLNLLQDFKNEVNEIIEDLYLQIGDIGDLITDEMTEEGLIGDMKTEIPTAAAIKHYLDNNTIKNATQV